jgi:FkbM family methyltransferase
MLSVATRRRRLCADLLAAADAVIGLADVGSGGVLKRPWNLLPAARLRKFDFEPTATGAAATPLCVSNRAGEASFYIAHDERASSFHRALPQFAARYGMQSLFHTRAIAVRCITLDQYFADRYESVDALDVNVEGHDLQVLEGARGLLAQGSLKLLKVEFELAAVWEGQGWLSDIDPLLRHQGYELAGIDIAFARPVSVRHCFHRGEPLWGKATYVPGAARWTAMLERLRSDPGAAARAVTQGVALYVAADMPARALEVLELLPESGKRRALETEKIRARITGVYRWAKLERGVSELSRLAARAIGVRGACSEA